MDPLSRPEMSGLSCGLFTLHKLDKIGRYDQADTNYFDGRRQFQAIAITQTASKIHLHIQEKNLCHRLNQLCPRILNYKLDFFAVTTISEVVEVASC